MVSRCSGICWLSWAFASGVQLLLQFSIAFITCDTFGKVWRESTFRYIKNARGILLRRMLWPSKTNADSGIWRTHASPLAIWLGPRNRYRGETHTQHHHKIRRIRKDMRTALLLDPEVSAARQHARFHSVLKLCAEHSVKLLRKVNIWTEPLDWSKLLDYSLSVRIIFW